MGKVILFLVSLSLVGLAGCGTQYKYEIVGQVMVNDSLRDAVWYTDTVTIKNDTAYYFNSDNSKVVISGNYKIYKNK